MTRKLTVLITNAGPKHQQAQRYCGEHVAA
jgi:hypothetical protein